MRNSSHGKGHEEGGSAYAKAGSSLRGPPGNSRASTPKTRVCLLYCFVLSPTSLTLQSAVPHHLMSLLTPILLFFSRLGKDAILSYFFSCKLFIPPLNPYNSNMLISFLFTLLSHSLTSWRPVYFFASRSLLDLRDSVDTDNGRNNQHHSERLPQSSSVQSM